MDAESFQQMLMVSTETGMAAMLRPKLKPSEEETFEAKSRKRETAIADAKRERRRLHAITGGKTQQIDIALAKVFRSRLGF